MYALTCEGGGAGSGEGQPRVAHCDGDGHLRETAVGSFWNGHTNIVVYIIAVE